MTKSAEHFDLIVVGAGSGNSVLAADFDHWRVAIVERNTFGGTCLNRGCIPSKMFVYAADVAHQAGNTANLGVDSSLNGVRWGDIVNRVFGRIDPIAQSGEEYRQSQPNVTVFKGQARFIGHKTLDVNGQQISGEQIILAAGARPFVPPIPGLTSASEAQVEYHTSDSIMRLTKLPEHLIILGGGYIASELAHVFNALGSAVTIVNRSERLLAVVDEDISAAFTKHMVERMNCILNSPVINVKQVGSEITVTTKARAISGDVLLVAAGRVPNADQLEVTCTGVNVGPQGHVITDEFLRTNVEGIWALGDICHSIQLKHTANEDTRVVAHNIAHPEDLRRPNYSGIPYAVFSHPQIASVGATEQQLRTEKRVYKRVVRYYSDTAYAWAMEDTSSFVKLLADPKTNLLLGAHIIGPQAPILIQQLIQGMQFQLTVQQMARGQLYIHPALTEVVEQALLEF